MNLKPPLPSLYILLKSLISTNSSKASTRFVLIGYCSTLLYVAVIKHWQDKLKGERGSWLIFPGHSSSLREIRAGAEVETMQTCYLLSCSRGLLILHFIYLKIVWQVVVPPQWAGPSHSSHIKAMLPQTCLQTNMIWASSQLKSPLHRWHVPSSLW